eukprot:4288415-Pyramimonas_sp.AAC.1
MAPSELEELQVLQRVPAMIAAPTQWTCACGEEWALCYPVASKHFKGLVAGIERIDGLFIAARWGVRLRLIFGP